MSTQITTDVAAEIYFTILRRLTVLVVYVERNPTTIRLRPRRSLSIVNFPIFLTLILHLKKVISETYLEVDMFSSFKQFTRYFFLIVGFLC